MNPASSIQPLMRALHPEDRPSHVSAGDPASVFDQVVDGLLAATQPKRSNVPPIDHVAEFQRKLAHLNGLVQNAQIALNGLGTASPSLRSMKESEYFFFKSKLAQIGLPDGVNNIV